MRFQFIPFYRNFGLASYGASKTKAIGTSGSHSQFLLAVKPKLTEAQSLEAFDKAK